MVEIANFSKCCEKVSFILAPILTILLNFADFKIQTITEITINSKYCQKVSFILAPILTILLNFVDFKIFFTYFHVFIFTLSYGYPRFFTVLMFLLP